MNIPLPEQQCSTSVTVTASTEDASHQSADSNSKVSNHVSKLITKYATKSDTLNRSGTIDSELVLFRDEMETDALHFWKTYAHKYHNLACVAQVLLAIPIANAKAEGNFSIAGCLIRKERASLDPLRAEKILFIHDNYDLFGF